MADDNTLNDNIPDDDNGVNPDEGQSLVNPLPQDNDTPFSPPTDPVDDIATEDIELRTQQGKLDPTHPATDTSIDSDEAYDEGLSGAAEAEEPNSGSGDSVVNYDPNKDHRQDS